MDAHYFTAFCYEKIKQGLPNAKIKDSERLVNWARLVKSNTEIGYMKSAAKISEIGMKTAFDVIKPGVRQCDAVGEIKKHYFMEHLNLVGNIQVLQLCYQQERELQLHI